MQYVGTSTKVTQSQDQISVLINVYKPSSHVVVASTEPVKLIHWWSHNPAAAAAVAAATRASAGACSVVVLPVVVVAAVVVVMVMMMMVVVVKLKNDDKPQTVSRLPISKRRRGADWSLLRRC